MVHGLEQAPGALTHVWPPQADLVDAPWSLTWLGTSATISPGEQDGAPELGQVRVPGALQAVAPPTPAGSTRGARGGRARPLQGCRCHCSWKAVLGSLCRGVLEGGPVGGMRLSGCGLR